jgi:4a-hydroxytetrahydrobiopterin dehydratase
MATEIPPLEFIDAVEGWRATCDGASAFFATGSFAESARLVQAIARLEGVEDNPPKVDVRRTGVTVHLLTITENMAGMTDGDLAVAQQVTAAAAELGLKADPARVQSILVVPGAPDIREVMPFWRAALAYEPRPDSPAEDLVDPLERGPAFWFETMEEPRADGGGAIHLAVWVPHDMAEDRVAAALAAGGRMVRDEFAPMWWTLADAAGNEVDISTVKGRY